MLNNTKNEEQEEKSNDDYSWSIIESYFKNKHLKQLVKHQLESYNYFISTQIENTISMFNPVHICSENDFVKEHNLYRLEIFINFENFNIYRPQIYENNGATKILFPQEARLRNFTYSSTMTLDLNVKCIVRNGENYKNTLTYNKSIKRVNIGKIPIMLKSDICVLNQYKHLDNDKTGECKMDPGGYFIINGSEKTCIGQERAAENQIFCFNVSKNNTKWTWLAELKSIPDWKFISPKQINVMISSKNNGFGYPIYLQIPRLKNPIPLFIVFRAFNIISDKEICEKILLDISKNNKQMIYALQASIVDANHILTYESAIRYITSNVIYTPLNVDKETGTKKKNEFAMEVLNNDIFPHCKTDVQKIYMLGYMANTLLQTSFGWIEESNRDSYLNKRIDLTGSLLNNLFRNYFNKLVKDLQKQITREINNGSWKSNEDYDNIINSTNIYKIIKSTTIENGIKRALATGDFGIKQINSNKVGVAQVLNRLTYVSSVSHLRRINTPIDKSGKLVPPRRLHNSSWGFLCPAETPEGASVGIVKNMSYMCHITIPSNSSALYDYVLPLITPLDGFLKNPNDLYDIVKVFINGCWVGVTSSPLDVYKNLKNKKYAGIINIYTSIIFDCKLKEIKLCNDAGRLSRPLLKVENNTLVYNNLNKVEIFNKLDKGEYNFNDLLYSGKIEDSILEYLDAYEQNNSMIAMKSNILNEKTDKYIYKYSHCEIHPSTIFGVLASCIPFPENNQSPRNTYQCLDTNTPVLMKDQSYKLIKDIKVGDYVQTFDPKTMKTSYTKIINQYVRTTDKQMYNITTYSGKSFNATYDHKFMTYNGWKEVKDLELDIDLIGIKPDTIELSHKHSILNNRLICDSNMFKEILINDNLKETLITKYTNHLESLELLPLYYDNEKIPILARMFGFVLADGTLTYHKRDNTYMLQADFGSECGAELFELDVEDLGFNKVKCKEGFRTFKESTHHTWNVCHQGVIGCLFKVLGMVSGKKTTQASNDIPLWIKEGSDLTKREFLAGIQGGDGCQIRYNKLHKKGYNYICAPLSMTKNAEHKESLEKMMNSISEMFNYFGITNKVFSKLNIKEDDRYVVGIQISSSQDNLIKYYDTIGYKYDTYKITKSGVIIEYLKYKKSIIDRYHNIVTNVREFYDRNKNMDNTKIANALNIGVVQVSSIIRSYKNNRKICSPNLREDNIDNFVNKCKIINDAIFVPLKSKTQIDMNLISDITTESENHSFFIKGGIMTHNSAMGKQAIGMYVTNFDNRMDKTAYVLSYPMRPLVDTRLMNIIKLNNIPSGEQVIVAIASHTGYNQEDSILFNKSSIDRGLFLATIYHTEKDEDKKIFGNEEIRCKPDKTKTKNMKFANYEKIDSNGVIPENTIVEDKDVIIAKVLPIKENKNDFTKTIKYTDESHIYRTHEETYIDKNYIDCNGDGYNFCKVRVRNYRKPVIGDKFCIKENALILTSDGWFTLKDIDITKHKVATLKNNNELDYVYPVDKYEFDCFDEPLYSIKSQQVHMVCTKEHKLYLKKRGNHNFEFIEAYAAFGKRMKYKKDALNVNKDIEEFVLDKEKYNMDYFLMLLGSFISDGWVEKGTKYTRINIAMTKKRKKDFIENVLNKLNIHYNMNNDRVLIGNTYKELINYFKLLSVGASNKYLPKFIYELSQRQSIILMDSLIQGDGSYNKQGSCGYYTSSFELANQIQQLALHCGWSGTIRLYNTRESGSKRLINGRIIKSNYDNYCIRIIKTKNNPEVNHGHVNEENIQEETYLSYTGKVGCIEVPDTHLFYYKEDIYSPPVWTGNSSRHKCLCRKVFCPINSGSL